MTDKLTPTQQLSFPFDTPLEEKPILQASCNSVILNFNDALLEREKTKVNNLYKQILDSVRHIG